MSTHGNSNQNDGPHHLYEIKDLKEDDIFKYGISHEPIGDDGMSKRMRTQVNFLNLAVGWIRYVARVILSNIPGRVRAKESEDEYVEKYREEHGRRPRGNRR